MDTRKLYILVIAVFFGSLLAVQTKSFEDVTTALIRDVESNVFQEIQILKNKNEDLKTEIVELEGYLTQLTDQDQALEAIQEEIGRYKALSGKFSIFGPGLNVTLTGGMTTPWMIDLVNAFFTAGAEAVSINGIRIVNHTVGFDTLPQGQILLNGSILSEPYEFLVIGETEVIRDVLELPGGIFDRLEATFDDLGIETEEMDIIQML